MTVSSPPISTKAVPAITEDDLSHFVQFYQDDDYLAESVARFVSAGLERGETAVVIATPAHRASIEKVLDNGSCELSQAVARGDYVAMDAAATLSLFMVNDRPDESLFIKYVGSVIAELSRRSDGGRQVRAFGEMVALLVQEKNVAAAIALEELWNKLAGQHWFSLFCAYPLNAFQDASDRALFETICKAHSHVLPSERHLRQSKAHRSRHIAALQQKALSLEAEIARREDLEAQLQAELADSKLLQRISSQMFFEEKQESLYETLVEAAVAIMRSDFASMQMFCPDRGEGGELLLLTTRGFTKEAAESWKWVSRKTPSSCGEVLRKGHRVIACDIEECAFLGDEGLAAYRAAGIKSMQSTPLLSRSGKLVGMISTHWRKACAPSERDLRLFDILARQAADLIERNRAQDELRASKEQTAEDLRAMTLLYEVGNACALAGADQNQCLQHIVDVALAVTGAQRGNLQLLDQNSGRLIIAAQRGFEEPFLESFSSVDGKSASACGVAMREGKRIVVEDVGQSDIFANEPSLEVMLAAGARALQSTPLISSTGNLLGIISTHYERPHRPSEGELRKIDLLARQAAEYLERLNAERALREADRRKDEFLATLAHELRNPLAPIRSALDIKRLQSEGQCINDELHQIMERQVRQLTRLVDDLLEVSRITSGKIVLRKEPVDVVAVIENAIDASNPLIQKAHHKLTVSLPLEPITVEADPVRLCQILVNLLNNAAKYTEPNGSITLTAKREGNEAIVVIRDTGMGVPKEMLPRVFEMFAQVDRTLNRSQGGLGIGLALAKKLAELHDGRIEARSSGPGKGSEFIVSLPCLEITDARRLEPSLTEAIALAASKKRILIVDDNKDAARALGLLLKRFSHVTRLAFDGDEALRVADDFRPDVILMDIGMPTINGYEAARQIRSMDWASGTKLVAVSGWGQEEDRKKSKESGFDFHFTKPVDIHDVITLLDAD